MGQGGGGGEVLLSKHPVQKHWSHWIHHPFFHPFSLNFAQNFLMNIVGSGKRYWAFKFKVLCSPMNTGKLQWCFFVDDEPVLARAKLVLISWSPETGAYFLQLPPGPSGAYSMVP